tara:strand:- start:879 stop:1010 length:132 start_codon:yes stop_codon:yes gene_type:complete
VALALTMHLFGDQKSETKVAKKKFRQTIFKKLNIKTILKTIKT